MSYKYIYIPSRPQVDTTIAIFLLRKFSKYENIKEAQIKVTPHVTEKEDGIFYLDVGGGEFDHHNKEEKITASELISKSIGIEKDKSISKLLELAKRDDFFGKGTMSDDPLDRAFGLPGLITALNRTYPENPNKIFEYIEPLLEAHYQEERKRNELLPKEIESLRKDGKVLETTAKQRGNNLKIIFIESDDTSMPGYLRSVGGGRNDVVAQISSKGFLNIMTRPAKKPVLSKLAEIIRRSELMISGKDTEGLVLDKPGKVNEVPNWYYDNATNSLLNGGVNPDNIEPTKIKKDSILKILELGLTF